MCLLFLVGIVRVVVQVRVMMDGFWAWPAHAHAEVVTVSVVVIVFVVRGGVDKSLKGLCVGGVGVGVWLVVCGGMRMRVMAVVVMVV